MRTTWHSVFIVVAALACVLAIAPYRPGVDDAEYLSFLQQYATDPPADPPDPMTLKAQSRFWNYNAVQGSPQGAAFPEGRNFQPDPNDTPQYIPYPEVYGFLPKVHDPRSDTYNFLSETLPGWLGAHGPPLSQGMLNWHQGDLDSGFAPGFFSRSEIGLRPRTPEAVVPSSTAPPASTHERGIPSIHSDVVETRQGYTITADVPGMTSKDIHTQFEGSSLLLRASRTRSTAAAAPEPEGANGASPLRRSLGAERYFGDVHRRFDFPVAVDPASLAVDVNDGILTMTVMKRS